MELLAATIGHQQTLQMQDSSELALTGQQPLMIVYRAQITDNQVPSSIKEEGISRIFKHSNSSHKIDTCQSL
jgi:hypothetical protein